MANYNSSMIFYQKYLIISLINLKSINIPKLYSLNKHIILIYIIIIISRLEKKKTILY